MTDLREQPWYLTKKTVKLRSVKNYAEAHNHVYIGVVVEETPEYLVIECRTFHFRRVNPDERQAVKEGEVCVRVIPWHRIEVIHVLPENTRWDVDFGYDATGNLVLLNEHRTLIGRGRLGGD